jgi:hypothetical protein
VGASHDGLHRRAPTDLRSRPVIRLVTTTRPSAPAPTVSGAAESCEHDPLTMNLSYSHPMAYAVRGGQQRGREVPAPTSRRSVSKATLNPHGQEHAPRRSPNSISALSALSAQTREQRSRPQQRSRESLPRPCHVVLCGPRREVAPRPPTVTIVSSSSALLAVVPLCRA